MLNLMLEKVVTAGKKIPTEQREAEKTTGTPFLDQTLYRLWA
jgi:hypothetical protein